MKLSIIATLYQSEHYIHEFIHRTTAVAKQLAKEDYEIILVNDGSLDNGLDLAIAFTEIDSHIVLIDLSRNFGHHKAMMTGLMYSKGDFVFLIDSDLEEEPEWLVGFFSKMQLQICDVVYGIQRRRKGNRFERWSGRLFYRLFNILSGFSMQEDLVTARLMSRRYVDSLILHKEREVFMAGLWHITGYVQFPFQVTKHSSSTSTYTLSRKMAHLINSVTSFSNVPLIGIFYIGALVSLISLIYIVIIVFYWSFLAKPLTGWTSLMASLWLLGGMIISFIGIIGIYISKIFSETKQRPYTIVRQVYGARDEGSTERD